MKSATVFFSLLILVTQCFTPATAAAQDKIRIGVPLFPTVSFPVFIAQERGFFERNGLKAEIIRINSEPTTYQALISGDIDATSGAPTGLVQSNLQGVPVVSLGSWDNLVSYTVATREKIDDLSQLKGKKIGINRLGGKSSLVLRVMLEDAGLNSMKDVTLLQLGGSQERLAALMRGGIDAAPVDFAFEPKMKQLGFFLVTGKKTPFMNGPLTVKVSSLQSNRSKWVRFVKSYLEATHYMTTNKEGSVEVLRRAVGLDDKETLDHAYEQMRARADVDLIPPDAAVDNLIKMMTYVDKRASSVDKSKLADYSILKGVGARQGSKKIAPGVMAMLFRTPSLQYSSTPLLQTIPMSEIHFVDTTLRDGQQSLWALGMRTGAMLPIAAQMDRVGFESMEFFVSIMIKKYVREHKENPWVWLREGTKRFHSTRLRNHGGMHGSGAFEKLPHAVMRLLIERVVSYGITLTRTSNCWNDFQAMKAEVRELRAHRDGDDCQFDLFGLAPSLRCLLCRKSPGGCLY